MFVIADENLFNIDDLFVVWNLNFIVYQVITGCFFDVGGFL
jgi:hypothetical protein